MKHRYLKNVATLTLNQEKCCGCAMCVQVCPHNVFILNGEKVQIDAKDSCMECGACAGNCPTGALLVNPGVGCAAAIIKGFLTGSKPRCGCSDSSEDSAGSCC